MNEFEEFLMFAARFIFILSQKVYNITLDILDWILYGIHLILWFIRRICLRISVSSFVRTIDDCIFFFKCFKEGCHSCRAMRDCLPPRYLRRCRRRIRKMFFCGLFTRDPLSPLPRHHNTLHALIQHPAQHTDRLLKLLVLFFIKLNLNDLLQTPGSDNTWQA